MDEREIQQQEYNRKRNLKFVNVPIDAVIKDN